MATVQEIPDDRVENATLLRRWTQTEGGKLHPAMGTETHYNKEEAEFEPKKNYHDLEEKIEEYQKTQSKESLGFDLKQCRWDDVKYQLTDAKSKYNAKGANNKFTHVMRNYVEPASRVILPLTDLIPDENGLGILRGGLALIFNAVKKRGADREKIFKAFEDIPDIIEKADAACRTFPDPGLRESTINLYDTLLEQVPKLIEFLIHEENFFRRAKQNLKSSESSRIDDAIDTVRRSADKLNLRMEVVWAKTDAATFENSEKTKKTADDIKTTVNQSAGQITTLQGNMSNVQTDVGHIKTQGDRIYELLSDRRGDNQQVLEELSKALAAVDKLSSMVQTGLLDMSMGREKLTTPSPTPAIVYQQVQNVYVQPIYDYNPVPRQSSPELLYELLRIVDVPDEVAPNDLKFVAKQSGNFDANALGQARSLMSNEQFEAWFKRRSGKLLVNGNFDSALSFKFSPISVFCASLAASFINMKLSITLYFFCGEHVAPHDDLKGPRGLVRSLISQLILFPGNHMPNADFMAAQETYQACDNHDIAALCYAFEMLVRSYPYDTTICCIVDDISAYERSDNGWDVKLGMVIDMFQNLTMDRELCPGFKVLLTSPTKSYLSSHGAFADSSVWLNSSTISTQPLNERSLGWEIAGHQAGTNY